MVASNNKQGIASGVVIGLAVAVLGAVGLVTGFVPHLFAGLIFIVAVGIIVATRRASRPAAGN